MQPPSQFPFRSVLSLDALIAFWRQAAAGEQAARASFAAHVLAAAEATPALQGPITNPSVLQQHRDVLDLLMTSVFAPAQWDTACAAAFAPFAPHAFYSTPAFDRLTQLRTSSFYDGLNISREEAMLGKTIKAYSLILRRCYGEEVSFDYPLIYTWTDEATGLQEYYKIGIDPRFCIIEPKGTLRPLTPEQLQRLKAEPANLPLWMELLPPEEFVFSGFTIITAVDVTEQEALSALKDDLLDKDALLSPEYIDQIQDRIRTLLRQPDLHLGLIGMDRPKDLSALEAARPVGRSLLLNEGEPPACPGMCRSIYAEAYASACEPVLVDDLRNWPTPTAFEAHLLDQGCRNLLLAPLHAEGEIIGLLELSSPRAGALNQITAMKLMQATTLFATALKRSMDEREDRVQAVIKEQYTAIHPVVEWRFRQAALRYMQRQGQDQRHKLEPILFPNVYPLYGLSDIRDSSAHRNAAIRADLVEQLGLALAVIVEAGTYRPLPVLDEIAHRIHASVADLESELRSEDEVGVLEFLQTDVEPLFPQLEGFGDGVRVRTAAYRAALDPALGILYRRRKAFEDSVTLITDTISAYLDAEQQHAQAMFPHYFEKYRTDGVDYNIYIGASLLEDGGFDPLYLRNLRLWQLMTMCGVVGRLDRMRPHLPVPLETTHLVLVQSAPLAIRFRQDEKKFDVDGAYNVRYEITKKRIDKAYVLDRQERLTQPGKIAIVYAQTREAAEYRRYIDYLQAAGYLQAEVEELALEDLQGVHGLRALRVAVADGPPAASLEVNPPLDLEDRYELVAEEA